MCACACVCVCVCTYGLNYSVMSQALYMTHTIHYNILLECQLLRVKKHTSIHISPVVIVKLIKSCVRAHVRACARTYGLNYSPYVRACARTYGLNYSP